MVGARTIVYGLSSLAVIAGLFNISLYFFDLISGQPTKGIVFFLRVGATLMVGMPVIIIQLVINTPPLQRMRRAERLSFAISLVIFTVGILLLVTGYAALAGCSNYCPGTQLTAGQTSLASGLGNSGVFTDNPTGKEGSGTCNRVQIDEKETVDIGSSRLSGAGYGKCCLPPRLCLRS